MATWKELEAQGVRRCCVHFKNGKQCRRRAVTEFDFSWCAKHGPIMEAYSKHAIAIMNRTNGKHEHAETQS